MYILFVYVLTLLERDEDVKQIEIKCKENTKLTNRTLFWLNFKKAKCYINHDEVSLKSLHDEFKKDDIFFGSSLITTRLLNEEVSFFLICR